MDDQSVFAATNVFRSIAPERIVSGADSIEQLPRLLQKMGADRILIATPNSVMTKTPNVARLQGLLGASVVAVFPRCREHSPEQDIFELVDRLKETGTTAVVSIGGSSVFDTVKVALSRLADAQGAPPHPQIAIPTTLSAGEFTPGAGYTAAASGEKALVLDLRVSPRLVILDPTVTQDTPESLWFGSAIKAIDHAMEAVWSRTPHPYVDALALEAIRLFSPTCPDRVTGMTWKPAPPVRSRPGCRSRVSALRVCDSAISWAIRLVPECTFRTVSPPASCCRQSCGISGPRPSPPRFGSQRRWACRRAVATA